MKSENWKLNYIKHNYKNSRIFDLLKEPQKAVFHESWVNSIINISPRFLYKYRSFNAQNVAALLSKKAWFSRPSTWNDPIDATVQYNPEKDIADIDKNFDKFALKIARLFMENYLASYCNQKKTISLDELSAYYDAAYKGSRSYDPSRIVTVLTPIVGEKVAMQISVKTYEALKKTLSPEFKTKFINSLNKMYSFNDIRDKMILFSLSETFTNNHQWAVYGDGGKGFCIGYEIKPKTKEQRDLMVDLLPIYYGKKPNFSLKRMIDESIEYSTRPELIEDLANQESEKQFVAMFTKEKEWQGEQEWRFAIEDDVRPGSLIDFDFAKNIYLGDKMSASDETQLIDIARKNGITVYKRKLDSTKSRFLYQKVLKEQ
jgi:hypothetical protein